MLREPAAIGSLLTSILAFSHVPHANLVKKREERKEKRRHEERRRGLVIIYRKYFTSIAHVCRLTPYQERG